MIRFAVLATLALGALVPARSSAQPVTPESFRVVEVKADKGKLTWTEIKGVPVERQVEVVVNINGMNVKQKRTVTVYEYVTVVQAAELKTLKATDGAGKAVDAEKLAELLKEKTAVVLVSGPVPEKHRKLFKETTVFVELPQLKAPKDPPPFPVPPKVEAPVPPVVLPPGEKSGR